MDERFVLRMTDYSGVPPGPEATLLHIVVTQVGLWTYRMEIEESIGDPIQRLILAKAAYDWIERHPEYGDVDLSFRINNDYESCMYLVVA